MELQISDSKEMAKLLFEFLNEKGVYLITTECGGSSIDTIQRGTRKATPIIRVLYKQVNGEEFSDCIREFLNTYASRQVVITDTQRGSDANISYVVVKDEGGYYNCTCPFFTKTNKICHHIVALTIREHEGTLHYKATKIVKKNVSVVGYHSGTVIAPFNINDRLHTYESRQVVYDLLKYGFSMGQIKEHYHLHHLTGYDLVKSLGENIKADIQTRLKRLR